MGRTVNKYKKCCRCKSDKSYVKCIDFEGKDIYLWHSHRCNDKFCTGYLCHTCLLEEKRLETERVRYDMSRRTCCKCGMSDTYLKSSGTINERSCICGKVDCTKYLCKRCSYGSLWRDGKLDPDSSTGKGFIGQQIVAKRFNVDDCNLKMNNFRFYVDLSKISGYGYSEVKITTLNIMGGTWGFSKLDRNCDTFFFVCMDNNKPWKDVDRMYAILWESVIKRSSITIYKNPSRGGEGKNYDPWYEQYRICADPFNDIYHNLKLEDCKVLKKRK